MANTTIRTLLAFLALLIVCILLLFTALSNAKKSTTISNNLTSAFYHMKLTTDAFNDGEVLPAKYTCDDFGVRPLLEIGDVPGSAKSLAIIMRDPDAPGGNFTHWTVWNMPATTAIVSAAKIPEGSIEGATSLGQPGWVPPCPPLQTGSHHYIFNLYALTEMLTGLSASTTEAQLNNAMKDMIVAQTSLTGTYERKAKK